MAECEVLYERNIPRILATPLALYKMRYYIDKTDKEIGWLGYVKRDGENIYRIEDVFLLKQEVHSTTTEIEPDALANLATELIKQGEDGIAKYNKLRLWGHSHVNMSTSASSQDDDQMDEFATSDFYIRLIGNKKGEWNVCLYDYENNLLWSGLSLELDYPIDITDEELNKEIEDNVKEKTYTNYSKLDDVYKRPSPLSYYDRYYDKYIDDDYGYGYGYGYGYSKQNKEKKEKEEEPYEIKGKITKEDLRNIKRYYSSDENTLLFMFSCTPEEFKQELYEDYGITAIETEVVIDLQEELQDIWVKKYSEENK